MVESAKSPSPTRRIFSLLMAFLLAASLLPIIATIGGPAQAQAPEFDIGLEADDPPASNVFGNPDLPDWKDVTVEDTADFIIVNNADNLIFKFRKGTAGYNEIWQNDVQIVADERWVIEYLFNAPDTWKTRGLPQYVEWEQPENYHVVVKRYYRDWGEPETTFWVVYDFYGGFRPKISVEMEVGQEDNYRIAWKASGINKTHVAENFNYVKFWNDGEEAIVFDYSDVYEEFGDITEVEIEPWANDHKLNEYFHVGSLGVGDFKLDPNFGYEDSGQYGYYGSGDYLLGSWFVCPEDGTADNITYYQGANYTGGPRKLVIYTYPGNQFVGVTEEGSNQVANSWNTLNFSDPKPPLSAGQAYWLFHWGEEYYLRQTPETNKGGEQAFNYPGTLPDPCSPEIESRRFSIYCSYTAGAPPAPGKPVLVSPENNYSTSDNTPTFAWENGSDATSHRLVIDNSQDFDDGENIYDNAGAWDNSGTAIENELPADNYWWKVCATNAQGDNWSENTWTFEVTPPPPGIFVYPPAVYVATTWTVPGETVKVSVLVLDANNAPITGLPSDNVNYDLWSPQSNLAAENVGMSETSTVVSPGLYENSWTFASTDNLGTWTIYVAVDSAGTKSYSIAHIRLEPSIARIENKVDWMADYLENTMKPELDSILDNVQNNYTYLSGTIKPQLDTMSENIGKTLDNAVEVYAYLTGTVKPAIDDAYNQAVANYDYLTDTIKPQLDNIQENLSVTAELPENIKENIFATYSFLIENIKPELDNVYENVNASYSYLINTINPKLDEIAAGIGVGLSIEVTRYYQLDVGDLQEFYVTIGKGTNVDWVTITLENPKNTLIVDNASMSNPETGVYYYSFSTSGRESGGWLSTIVAKDENVTTTYLGFWRLGGEGEAVGYLTLTLLDNETNEPVEGAKVELYKAGTLVESKYARWDGRAFLDIMTWDIHELRWSKDGYETETMEIDLTVSSDLTLKMVPTKEKGWVPPITWILGALAIGCVLTTSVYYGSKKRAKAASLGTAFILPAILLGISWCAGVVG